MCHLEPLEWDSEFFGFPVGKITLTGETHVLSTEIARKIRSSAFELVYLISDIDVSKDLVEMNFEFHMDIKITYEKLISKEIQLIDPSIFQIYEVIYANDEIEELAIHSGKYSRFFLDSRFPSDMFRNLYIEWIRKSIQGKLADKVLVYFQDGIKGFVTVKFLDGTANIGLIAVDSRNQSLGIGSKLLHAAKVLAAKENCNTIIVATQEANQGANKFYLRNGFKTKSKKYIYHLWKEEIK